MATTKHDLQVMLKRASEAAGVTLNIEKWSPGDGWTRYRVKALASDGNEYGIESHYMTRSECLEFLNGMEAAAEWKHQVDRLILSKS